MKTGAKETALEIFLEADGQISNAEIADLVGASPLTVAKWKRKDGWDLSLLRARADNRARTGAPEVKKKAARDKALRLFLKSEGNITNKALAKQVGVGLSTIRDWKRNEAWSEKLKQRRGPSIVEPGPVRVGKATKFPETQEEAPARVEERQQEQEIEVNLNELTYPDQITRLNKRIDDMLNREFLSAIDLKALAEAKEAVLRAVSAYVQVLDTASENRG